MRWSRRLCRPKVPSARSSPTRREERGWRGAIARIDPSSGDSFGRSDLARRRRLRAAPVRGQDQEQERCGVRSTTLDEFPKRRAGDRIEQLARDLPNRDEEEKPRGGPYEDRAPKGDLEPPDGGYQRHRSERKRMKADGAVVLREHGLVHHRAKSSVTDQEKRQRNPNHREYPRPHVGRNRPLAGMNPREPLGGAARPPAPEEERQRNAVVPGTLERLPNGLAGQGPEECGPEPPDRSVQDQPPHGAQERHDADGEVDGADDGHQAPCRGLGKAHDPEVGHPGPLPDDSERAMADELHQEGNAEDPVNQPEVIGRGGRGSG